MLALEVTRVSAQLKCHAAVKQLLCGAYAVRYTGKGSHSSHTVSRKGPRVSVRPPALQRSHRESGQLPSARMARSARQSDRCAQGPASQPRGPATSLSFTGFLSWSQLCFVRPRPAAGSVQMVLSRSPPPMTPLRTSASAQCHSPTATQDTAIQPQHHSTAGISAIARLEIAKGPALMLGVCVGLCLARRQEDDVLTQACP